MMWIINVYDVWAAKTKAAAVGASRWLRQKLDVQKSDVDMAHSNWAKTKANVLAEEEG